MKKILSVSLIVIMILAMGLSALGIGAEEASATTTPTVGITEEATGADATKAGNLTTPGSKTFDSSWTAISDQAGLNSMTANGKYYLTANINVTSVRNNTANQTIDGNGYTITANCPIFNEVKGLTLQNVTIKSTLNHNSDSTGGYVSALARWNSHEKPICVSNVTIETNITSTKNTGDHQYFGAFAMRSCAGSKFENVVATTNVTFDNANVAKINSVGGLVGRAEGTTFDNCIANGTFTFKQNPFKDNNISDSGIGGIAGAATATSTVKNCTSNVKMDVDAVYGVRNFSMGGIVGFSNSGTTFYNCVNNGAITTTANATKWQVGGIVGNYYGGISIVKCKNTADISCAAADYVGGILGHCHKAVATISNCINTGNISNANKVGGIIGWSSVNQTEKVSVSNCTNTGSVTCTAATKTNSTIAGGIIGHGEAVIEIKDCLNTGTAKGVFTVGGIAGYLTNATVTIEGCVNGVEGDKTVAAINGPGGTSYVGGIAGAADKANIKNCVNYANISGNGTARIGGIVGQLNSVGGFWGCVNYGNVTESSSTLVGGLTGDLGNVTVTAYVTSDGKTIYNANYGDIKGGGYVGGLFGKSTATKVDYCINNGKVEGSNIGGIIGQISANIDIDKCYNNGQVIATNSSGGIIGLIDSGKSVTIDDCTNTGYVEGKYRTAGIVGYVKGPVTATNCINGEEGTDKGAIKTTGADAWGAAGGILGWVENSHNSVLKGCINYGPIYATGTGSHDTVGQGGAGGIVGKPNHKVTIGGTGKGEACINYGSVTAEGVVKAGGIAGFVGTSGTASDFVACENYGNVTSVTHAGGIIGEVRADLTISGVKNYGNVTAGSMAAGIVANATKSLTVKNCVNGYANEYDKITIYNTGVGNTQPLGGIVAYVGTNLYAEGCYNYAKLSNPMSNVADGMTTADKLYYGAKHVGGIAGEVKGSAFVGYNNQLETTVGCYNYGTIETVGFGHTSYIGGILGYDDGSGSKIYGSENHGNIVILNKGYNGSYHGVGGIMGYACGKENTTTTVTDCANYGNITIPETPVALWVAGGIVGGNWAKDGFVLEISGCYNEGDITAHHVGGIGGKFQGAVVITDCENAGAITTNATVIKDTADYKGDYTAGGILGTGNSSITISKCTNTGAVRAGTSGGRAGGILGHTKVATYISGCCNEGTITTNFVGGGMVGWTEGSAEMKLENCVNGVKGDSTKGIINAINSGDYVGGIVGALQSGKATDCINYGAINGVGGDTTGGITGQLYSAGSIEGAKNYGDVTSATGNAGGLVGVAGDNVTLENLYNYGNVKAGVNAGGIVATAGTGFKAINCVNGDANKINGIVIENNGAGSTGSIGGIVAQTNGTALFEGCYNYAKLYNPAAHIEEGNTGSAEPYKDAWYYGAKHVGGIVGLAKGALIIGYDADDDTQAGNGCYNYGSIEAAAFGHTSYIGGIVGYDAGNTKINGCENRGAITLLSKGSNGHFHGAGGIMGYACNKADTTTTIINCKNYGAITTPENSVALWVAGGIVGGSWSAEGFAVSIDGCYNYGDIYAHYAGGIAGKMSSDVAVTNSSNNGAITSDGSAVNSGKDGFKGNYCAGGIVGSVDGVFDAANCRNYGDVSAYDAGGIIGIAVSASTVNNCQNYANVSGVRTAGGIGGWFKTKATVTNCANGTADIDVTISEANYAGGIAGAIHGSYAIKDCVNYADISGGNSFVGGIAGELTGDSEKGIELENLKNYGDVTASGAAKVGGVIGSASSVTVFKNIENNGDITVTSSKCYHIGGIAGNFSGGIQVSGLVNNGSVTFGTKENPFAVTNADSDKWARVGGIFGLSNAIKYMSCVNNGDITVIGTSEDGIFVGGLIGITYDAQLIRNCRNTGDITAVGASGNHYGTGGLIGWTNKSGIEILNCSNTGDVIGDKFVGGMIGFISAAASFNGATNEGDVTGTGAAGGFVSACGGATFIDCENSGNVVGGTAAGGFIATSTGAVSIERGINRGNVTVLGTATKENARGVGGFIGGTFANGVIEIYDSVNYGTITQSKSTNGSMTGTGGFIGRVSGEGSSGYANLQVIIKDCSNEGDVVSASVGANGDAMRNLQLSRGGFIGMLNTVGYVEFENCINLGDLLKGEWDAFDDYTGVGGFVGIYRCLGQTWTTNITDAKLIFKNCVNAGDVEATGYAGGFLGKTLDFQANGGAIVKITLDNCLNKGDVSALWAGGLVGSNEPNNVLDNYKNETVVLDIKNTMNTGKISGGNGAGGAIAYAQGGTIQIEGFINEGAIEGIYSAGFVAKADDSADITIKNSASIGSLVSINKLTLNPAVNGGFAYENNRYTASAVADKGYDRTLSTALSVAEEGLYDYEFFWGYGYDRLAEILAKAEIVALGGANKYSAYTWNRFIAALEYARDIFAAAEADSANAKALPTVTQADMNRAFNQLTATYGALTAKGEATSKINSALSKAEGILEHESAYLPKTWSAFKAAYEALKAAVADIEDFEAIDSTELVALAEALDSAIKGLVAGGEIYTAEDFANINGLNGTYVLMDDITISTSLESLQATIVGNGHTITLNGCAIADVSYGASVSNVVIKGNAGGAKSVFGKAIKNVSVSNLTVEVEDVTDAALFHAADKNATINVKYVISYTEAGVGAILGNVNCAVTVDGAVANATAPALVGIVAKGSTVKGSYLNGVEYYNEKGEKITSAEVLASGKVAYEMNVYLEKLVAAEGITTKAPTFVQVIGTDAAPAIGAEKYDNSNVVVAVYDSNNVIVGYKNPTLTPDLELEEKPEMPEVTPAAPVYDALNAAIERANALDEALYTAESWAALKEALENANAALEYTVQADIDEATNALNLAVAELVIKPAEKEEVDYAGLEEVIAQAEALNEKDYTDGSWAALQAALAKAELAREYEDQADVDSAKTALARAIAALVKAPVESEEQAPEDNKPETNKPETDAPGTDDAGNADETDGEGDSADVNVNVGCGGLIGGAAVVFTALVALAGVSLKKKED